MGGIVMLVVVLGVLAVLPSGALCVCVPAPNAFILLICEGAAFSPRALLTGTPEHIYGLMAAVEVGFS